MSDKLDLYGRGSRARAEWKPLKLVPIGLAVVLVASTAGYRWLTSSTPITDAAAVEIFRQQQRDRDEAWDRGNSPKERSARDAKKQTTGEGQGGPARPGTGARQEREQSAVAAPPMAAPSRDSRSVPAERSTSARTRPREGVYSWATKGYEEASGARRSLPEESQRIITLEGNDGWDQHHYFSEEREIWTTFRRLEQGVSIAFQRNKVTFGPVTNDSRIIFSPPMLVGPADLEVGQTWKGSWSGDTYGTYEGRTFAHSFLNIDGERVETWAVEVDIHLRGEQEGEVQARVWMAPKYAMTVREEYVQDVKVAAGSYHGEWSMTIESLQPRR